MLENASIPAVVLVCHHHVGLGIVRSLGRLGVEVYGIDADRHCAAFFSKYCRGKFVWDLHTAPVDDSLRFLENVGKSIGRRSVLIPTSDGATLLVDEHASRLKEWFIFPDRDPGTIRALCSKREMYYLARNFGIPTPETSFPQSEHDVHDYLRSARFPILIKPIYPHLAIQADKPWRMSQVNSKQELLNRYRAVEDSTFANVMLQEYIPGGDEMTWTFNGYFDRNGDCRVLYTGRKLRNFPPYFGQASFAVCVVNNRVQESALRFMKAIGYRGALDLGFRYDSRDDQYKVNDVNPRVGAMFRLFVGANGMDVVRALYQDMTDQEIIPSTTVEGRKWIVEDVDLVSSLKYCWDRKLRPASWLGSLAGINETTFFASDDLMPVLGACIMDAKRMLRHRSSKGPAATMMPTQPSATARSAIARNSQSPLTESTLVSSSETAGFCQPSAPEKLSLGGGTPRT